MSVNESSMQTNNKKFGFTLIELLVVISIISLLSSVVLASTSAAKKKAVDAATIAENGQIRNSLELYYNQHGGYPAASCPAGVPVADCVGPTHLNCIGNTDCRSILSDSDSNGSVSQQLNGLNIQPITGMPVIDGNRGFVYECDTVSVQGFCTKAYLYTPTYSIVGVQTVGIWESLSAFSAPTHPGPYTPPCEETNTCPPPPHIPSY